MSRSGYSEDAEYIDLWRASVARAAGGKRGQQFFRDLVAALDAMPEKRLIAEELEQDGEVCALGVLGRLRNLNLQGIDPEDHDRLSKKFKISRCLVQEVEYVNDDDFGSRDESPEARYQRVYQWAKEQIHTE